MFLSLRGKIKNTDIGTHNERNRINWMKNVLSGFESGLKILDAGAGELKFKKFCNHLQYTSQDFAQYDGLGDGIGLQTNIWDNSKIDIISDITEMPIGDEEFDIVMCNEVLEHVPDPIKALYELNRVLKNNGWLILTAPFCSLTHFAPYHFSTGFSKYWYEHHLKEMSHEIIEININGNYYEYLAQEIRRVSNVANKYSNLKVSEKEKQNFKKVLMSLDRLNIDQNNSNELLFFGAQVLSKKTILKSNS